MKTYIAYLQSPVGKDYLVKATDGYKLVWDYNLHAGCQPASFFSWKEANDAIHQFVKDDKWAQSAIRIGLFSEWKPPYRPHGVRHCWA